MTAPNDHFDRLEQLLKTHQTDLTGFPDTDLTRVAAWVEQPSDDADIDRLLAGNAHLRKAVIDLRLDRLSAADVSPSMRHRLHRLMPEPIGAIARIGGWLAAAAAVAIVAVAGYRLGDASLQNRMLHDDTMATVTFGLSQADDDSDFFALLTPMTGDDQ